MKVAKLLIFSCIICINYLPVRLSISITPAGVAGIKAFSSTQKQPTFNVWNPSTSLCGATEFMTCVNEKNMFISFGVYSQVVTICFIALTYKSACASIKEKFYKFLLLNEQIMRCIYFLLTGQDLSINCTQMLAKLALHPLC